MISLNMQDDHSKPISNIAYRVLCVSSLQPILLLVHTLHDPNDRYGTSQFVSSPDLCQYVYVCVPQNIILLLIYFHPGRYKYWGEKVCGLLLCNTCVFCIGVKGVYLCLFADAGWARRCSNSGRRRGSMCKECAWCENRTVWSFPKQLRGWDC